jgi:hypothetical protein
MSAKGYVVRGRGRGQRDVYAYWELIGDVQWVSERDCVPHDGRLLFASIGDAVNAVSRSSHLTDVRIFEVAEDGTETPLSTHEEALTEIGQLRAELAQTEKAWHTAVDDALRLNAVVVRQRLQKAASHEAWARYVTAAIEDRDAQFAEEQEMADAEAWRARTQKNLAIATAALRDLGVDVNTLLNAKTRTT